MTFFAIWWAWMNFTWFASAYDTDDVLYRLLTFVQIAGVLVIASGVERAFTELDYATMTVGYVIMRIGLVAQWLRVAIEHADRRQTALRYAIGVTLLQLGWVSRLFVPAELGLLAFAPLVVLELLVPVWAESTGHPTPFHGGHIAERYGLFTIIVLGECILAASTAVQEAVTAGGLSVPLTILAASGLVLVLAMWWVYFKHDSSAEPRELRQAFIWGYGHYFIFAAVAATGAGLHVAADLTHQEAEIGTVAASLAVAVPVVISSPPGWSPAAVARPRRSLRCWSRARRSSWPRSSSAAWRACRWRSWALASRWPRWSPGSRTGQAAKPPRWPELPIQVGRLAQGSREARPGGDSAFGS
jgi:low temperature requirement protein LtrA